MKRKKLSIIIPVYNVEKYVPDTLESIISKRNELLKWIEIILIDDGSTDNSGNICDLCASKYSFVKVIHQKNQGLSGARNSALGIASGEWIVFVDSDDIVRTDYVSVLLDNIKHNKEADIIIFKFRMFNSGDNIENKINKVNDYSPKNISSLSKSTAMYYLTIDEIGNFAWNKMFKKELFNDIKFPVGRRYEDIAVMYKCFQLANRIYLYNDYLYFYRQRANSILHATKIKDRVNLYRDSLRARKAQLDFFKKYKYYDALKNANQYFMVESVHYIFWVNKAHTTKDKEYMIAQEFLSSYTPKLSDGKNMYLFVNAYKKFPKLIEKCIRILGLHSKNL